MRLLMILCGARTFFMIDKGNPGTESRSSFQILFEPMMNWSSLLTFFTLSSIQASKYRDIKKAIQAERINKHFKIDNFKYE